MPKKFDQDIGCTLDTKLIKVTDYKPRIPLNLERLEIVRALFNKWQNLANEKNDLEKKHVSTQIMFGQLITKPKDYTNVQGFQGLAK